MRVIRENFSFRSAKSRDSSVGRASDWRSEGPWFNPGSRQQSKIALEVSICKNVKYSSIVNGAVAATPSCDGRVVKAFDLKSNGFYPRRFESYSQRNKTVLPFLQIRVSMTSRYSAEEFQRTSHFSTQFLLFDTKFQLLKLLALG